MLRSMYGVNENIQKALKFTQIFFLKIENMTRRAGTFYESVY